MNDKDFRHLDEVDFKKEFPKEYYLGYDKGSAIYDKGHKRSYLSPVEITNPYCGTVLRLQHWAWFTGLYDGYDYANDNDIKTQI
jgi:hypothetical protein